MIADVKKDVNESGGGLVAGALKEERRVEV